MQFEFTEEQILMRDSARAFLAANAPSARVRAAIATDLSFDLDLWRRVAAELGWAGSAIAERHGGAGLGMVELCILEHELGRRLVPSPFFSTVCLAAPLITAAATDAQKDLWLRRIATGEVRIAVALADRHGGAGAQRVGTSLRRVNGSWRLAGECGFVILGQACDVLLVAASESGAAGEAGIRLALVDPSAPGVRIEGQVMLDLTRSMSRIRFDDVSVESAELLGGGPRPAGDFECAIDRARVALASEAVGGAEYCLEMTTKYVKERIQFDRPIGSFQAVKHRLADMMVLVEAAKSASWYAACIADEDPENLAQAASIAKSTCCDAFFQCAGNAIQLHGGIGFSWDHDAHLYFKRARAAGTLLGSSNWHRERLAVSLDLGQPACTPAY